MIQANELRINNLVNCTDKEYFGIKRVSSINDYTKRIGLENNTGTFEEMPYRLVDPIPLTPEILEKCGFSKNGEYFEISNPGDDEINETKIIYRDEVVMIRETILQSDLVSLPCRILYLHQLQNLYFALTGQELTVNL